MSFAIAAIYRHKDVYLATDSQVVNRTTGLCEHDAVKIRDITGSTGVAYAGSATFCEEVVDTLLESYKQRRLLPAQNPMIANDLQKTIEALEPKWIGNFIKKPAEAVFFVAGFGFLGTPSVITIILSNHTVKQYTTGWEAGDYLFSAAPPEDMNYDDGIELCKQVLAQSCIDGQDQEATLAELVCAVSRQSNVADNLPQIWKAKPHS